MEEQDREAKFTKRMDWLEKELRKIFKKVAVRKSHNQSGVVFITPLGRIWITMGFEGEYQGMDLLEKTLRDVCLEFRRGRALIEVEE